jgi:hypothetical protein
MFDEGNRLMARATSETAPSSATEDLWLSYHDLWMQPVEWWTAWWNAWATPIAPCRLHRHLTHRFDVPEPIDRAGEQDLFA